MYFIFLSVKKSAIKKKERKGMSDSSDDLESPRTSTRISAVALVQRALENYESDLCAKDAATIARFALTFDGSRDEKARVCLLVGICLVNHNYCHLALEPLHLAKVLSRKWPGTCWHILGVAHSYLGDQEKALEYFYLCKAVLAESSVEMGLLMRDLAFALCQRGELERALETGAVAVGLLNANGASVVAMGRCFYIQALIYVRVGNKCCALEYARRAKNMWLQVVVPRFWRKELTALLLRIRFKLARK